VVFYAVLIVLCFYAGFHLDYISMMYTPRRPVKRQLVFTPASTAKRFRSGPVATRAYRNNYKHAPKSFKTSGTLWMQVKALQRAVKNLSPEKKYTDLSLSQINIGVAGAVTHITSVAQGDTIATRTGNVLNLVSITCKGKIATAANALAVGSYMRILVVVDKQQVADTSPSAADVITDGIFTADPVSMLPNTAFLERFRILHSSRLYDGSRIATGTATQDRSWEYSWTGNMKVEYNGTAGTDIQKNGVYVVFLTDDAGNVLDFSGVARVGFTDV